MDQKPKLRSTMLTLASLAGAWALVACSMTRADAAPPAGTSCTEAFYQCQFRCTLDAVDVDTCLTHCGIWWRNGCTGSMPKKVLQNRNKGTLPPAGILDDSPTLQYRGPAPTGASPGGGSRGGSGPIR